MAHRAGSAALAPFGALIEIEFGSRVLPGAPWGSLGLPRAPWGSPGLPGPFRSSPELSRALRSLSLIHI
eukprot:1355285-Alexandrium_andersonii.AAC.1